MKNLFNWKRNKSLNDDFLNLGSKKNKKINHTAYWAGF